jgi:membrane-bound ClpP family serine protease
MLASIIVGFQHSFLSGFLILGVAVFGLPTILVLAFRYWPRTAMGRRVMLLAPSSQEVLPQDPKKEYLKSLVGKIGRAKCKMLPGGAITIDSHTVDAISEGMPIEAGQRVRVIQVRANRVLVRPAEDDAPSATAEDPLQRPIDSVTPDPFDEPAA